MTAPSSEWLQVLGSEAFRRDPLPAYAELREAGPVVDLAPGILSGTGRYQTADAVLADPRFGTRKRRSQAAHPMENTIREIDEVLVYQDPPAHTQIRRMFTPFFRPQAVRKMRPAVETIVEEVWATLPVRSDEPFRFDLLNDFVLKVTTRVINRIAGLPDSDGVRIQALASRGSKMIEPSVLLTQEDRQGIRDVFSEGTPYISDVLRSRRQRPSDDLVSSLAASADPSDPKAVLRAVANLGFLYVAGYETTSSAICSAILLLLEQPARLADIRANEDLFPRAIEECLRIKPPIRAMMRVPKEAADLFEHSFNEGERSIVFIEAANLDEQAFTNPDVVDLVRLTPHHLSFGGGIHFCLGAHLARLQMEITLRQIFRHVDLELEGEPGYDLGQVVLRRFTTFPVRAIPRGR